MYVCMTVCMYVCMTVCICMYYYIMYGMYVQLVVCKSMGEIIMNYRLGIIMAGLAKMQKWQR